MCVIEGLSLCKYVLNIGKRYKQDDMNINYLLIFTLLFSISSCKSSDTEANLKLENENMNSSFNCDSYKETQKDNFSDSAIIYQNKGIIHQFNNNLDSAIYYFNRSIETDSNMYVSHSNKGNVLIRLGDESNAIIEYKKVVAIKPKMPEFHMHLGNVYDYLGYPKEASTEYDIAIKLYSERIQCSTDKVLIEGSEMDRAIIYKFNNQEEKGRKEFKKMMESNKDKPMIQEIIKHQMTISKEDFFRVLFE